MAATTELLHQAYQHAEAGNIQYAKALLESLVSVEPLDIEAWEAYLQMCRSCDELDYLCDRFVQLDGLKPFARESLLDYYYFLRQKIEADQEAQDSQKMISFELVDQFTFTLQEHPRSSIDHLSDIELTSIFTYGTPGKFFILINIFLFVASMILLSNNILFGYWFLLGFIISVFIGLWFYIFPDRKTEVT